MQNEKLGRASARQRLVLERPPGQLQQAPRPEMQPYCSAILAPSVRLASRNEHYLTRHARRSAPLDLSNIDQRRCPFQLKSVAKALAQAGRLRSSTARRLGLSAGRVGPYCQGMVEPRLRFCARRQRHLVGTSAFRKGAFCAFNSAPLGDVRLALLADAIQWWQCWVDGPRGCCRGQSQQDMRVHECTSM